MCFGNSDTSVIGGFSDEELKRSYEKAVAHVVKRGMVEPIVKYGEIDGELKYTHSQKIPVTSRHIGQRKLILNEIQFLDRVPVGRQATIVYAGAAPSNKGAFLASLFPNLRFILIDPAPFNIMPYGDIKIAHLTQGPSATPSEIVKSAIDALQHAHICTLRIFMSGDIATELGKITPGVYFISDIRTNIKEDESPSTFDILWNSAQQMDWVVKMRPVSTMLKFRLPFYNETDEQLREFAEQSKRPPFSESFNETKDVIGFDSRIFKYFDGELYLQPWAPIASTETRLVFDGVPKIRVYNLEEYENKFFYYNKVLRCYQLYSNPYADCKIGFGYSADCALESKIWADYCKNRKCANVKRQIVNYVNILSRITHRPLTGDASSIERCRTAERSSSRT